MSLPFADLHDVATGKTVRYSSAKYARRAATAFYRKDGRSRFVCMDLATGEISTSYLGPRHCGSGGLVPDAMLWRRATEADLARYLRAGRETKSKTRRPCSQNRAGDAASALAG